LLLAYQGALPSLWRQRQRSIH